MLTDIFAPNSTAALAFPRTIGRICGWLTDAYDAILDPMRSALIHGSLLPIQFSNDQQVTIRFPTQKRKRLLFD
jgi:hypothetical protein